MSFAVLKFANATDKKKKKKEYKIKKPSKPETDLSVIIEHTFTSLHFTPLLLVTRTLSLSLSLVCSLISFQSIIIHRLM
jgi:hypothetical protein